MTCFLHSLSQQLISTQLVPSEKFLLCSSVSDDGQGQDWTLCLFWQDGTASDGGSIRVWREVLSLDQIEKDGSSEQDVVEAIESGMLQVVIRQRQVDTAILRTLDELQLKILVKPIPLLRWLGEGQVEDCIGMLMEATYRLLERPLAVADMEKRLGEEKDEDGDLEQLESLKAQIKERDAMLESVNRQLATLTSQASQSSQYLLSNSQRSPRPKLPKPPRGVSLLQPNQKRRRVVQEEFASNSD
ncbi:uncharacterized protein L203_104015 [Cryptococcus depauperatus CBS 7841]|uniref:Uncharacterized protein n=1 Tax=Cryptococcus depauperatus CBS 7841 TaxID=1295531 RepID=A0A1E3IBR2_9TREE|nr:hypothetical protein L203_04538 [Cryptococcus depauperatus CBS 7841]